MIECQRPVLSLFINHQGSMKKRNCKKIVGGIEGQYVVFFLHILYTKFEQLDSSSTSKKEEERVNIRMFRDNREEKKENGKDHELNLVGKQHRYFISHSFISTYFTSSFSFILLFSRVFIE
jgi:hypothetical protein